MGVILIVIIGVYILYWKIKKTRKWKITWTHGLLYHEMRIVQKQSGQPALSFDSSLAGRHHS